MVDNKIIKFYKDIDYTKLQPKQIALAYIKHFINDSNSYSNINIEMPLNSINNISVISQDNSLSFLTKRLPLISDKTVISQYTEKPQLIADVYDNSLKTNIYYNKTCYVHCPNFEELGLWLKNCKTLFINGDLFYYPNIIITDEWDDPLENYNISIESWKNKFIETATSPLFDFLIKNNKIIEFSDIPSLKSKYVYSILNIELPIIDNVDLETFSKLTTEEKNGVNQFRDLLRQKFIDLKENEKSEFSASGLQKIALEINSGVRQLNTEYEILKRKRIFQVTEAFIATTTAVLLAVNVSMFGFVEKIIGSGGGLLFILKALEEYIYKGKETRESPYYYLWLLSKKTR
jgi:hypothetical protein